MSAELEQIKSNTLRLQEACSSYKQELSGMLYRGYALIEEIREHSSLSRVILSSLVEIQNVELLCAQMEDNISFTEVHTIQNDLDDINLEALAHELEDYDEITCDVRLVCPGVETRLIKTSIMTTLTSIEEQAGNNMRLCTKFLGNATTILDIVGTNPKKELILRFDRV